MAKPLLSLILYGIFLAGSAIAQQKRNYIVQMTPTEAVAKRDHLTRRSEIEGSLQAADISPSTIIYTYDNVINGFAVTLTDADVKALSSQPGVLSIQVDQRLSLHTTETPKFLGLIGSADLYGRSATEYYSRMYQRDSEINAAEANIIIGVLDTGAWPENPSYDDAGMPAIPGHWKGSCEEGQDWTTANCNKKLIGAAALYQGYVAGVEADTGLPFNWTSEIQSARDSDGHGTHTSTTIGGSISANASLFGEASGTARGMAKDARLAIYKVCWALGCYSSDILAGMDKAIADGVNVISGSLGGAPAFGGEDDTITQGAFAAMEKGIFVSFSAGNSGPGPGTVANNSPWMLTVAASTLDRDFPATVTLGNGKNVTGVSLYSNGSVTDIKPLASTDILPMILSSQAGPNATEASLCLPDSLDPALVAGKIVVCMRGNNGRAEKGGIVKAAGGRAMILINAPANGEEVVADAYVLPAIHVGVTAGAVVLDYLKSGNASASMDFEGTRLGISAPLMASFSSRGPNLAIPSIMKPDITGPGVDVLAGWGKLAGPSSYEGDHRQVDYNIISGTSMSCPHLSGLAAYIMARRPHWSVAAIRSAMMTTAYTNTKGTSDTMLDLATSSAANPFSYGSGHVDPVAALDPGLIYDITVNDYKDFVCSINSTQTFITQTTRGNFTCNPTKHYSPYNLNYPSFAAFYDTSLSSGTYKATFRRTVTNVGAAGAYSAHVSVADADLVKVKVEPKNLFFAHVGEKKSFKVTVEMSMTTENLAEVGIATSYGRLEWTDGKHTVGSSLGFIWA